jgi:hypothetical protein
VKAVIRHANGKCAFRRTGILRSDRALAFVLLISCVFSSEAARECRRKKKEYIKCLEERVNGLENQNKALIEELRQLKELYCQRDETGHKISNNKTTTVTTSAR